MRGGKMNNCPMSITAMRMKQALEELEEINKLSIGEGAICLPAEIDGAMDALRQAIEQAEKQEQADQNETTAELRRLHDVNQELRGALEYLMEMTEEPPEANCRCHLSPPCGDCLKYSGLREAWEFARAAIAKATGETE
jgi:hypothetical protein